MSFNVVLMTLRQLLDDPLLNLYTRGEFLLREDQILRGGLIHKDHLLFSSGQDVGNHLKN